MKPSLCESSLRASHRASLYIQGGLGYFFNRTEFLVMDRLQGYLYAPLELEGEAYIGNKGVLNYGLGYRYLIFGNHLSTASEYGFNDDYYVTQKDGFGLSAFIGRTYYGKDSTLRSIRLIYEYWHIGAADAIVVLQVSPQQSMSRKIQRIGCFCSIVIDSNTKECAKRVKKILSGYFAKIKALYRRSDRFLHVLVGMPSYDKYLEHMRIHHPDKIPKTQKEFFAEALEAKYGAGSTKC